MEVSKDKIETILGWLAGIAIGLGVIVLVAFLVILSVNYNIAGFSNVMLPETAQVGDFIGGFVGAVWALSGVLLFYLALRTQRKEFSAQRQQLEFHRKELSSQRQEFSVNRITQIIYKQLELYDAALKSLTHNPENEKTLSGSVVLDSFRQETDRVLASVEADGKAIRQIYPLYSHWVNHETRAFLRTVRQSIRLVKSLTEQGKVESNKLGESYMLNEENRQYLFFLFVSNMDIAALSGYIDSMVKVHSASVALKNAPEEMKYQINGTIEWIEEIRSDLGELIVKSRWSL